MRLANFIEELLFMIGFPVPDHIGGSVASANAGESRRAGSTAEGEPVSFAHVLRTASTSERSGMEDWAPAFVQARLAPAAATASAVVSARRSDSATAR